MEHEVALQWRLGQDGCVHLALQNDAKVLRTTAEGTIEYRGRLGKARWTINSRSLTSSKKDNLQQGMIKCCEWCNLGSIQMRSAKAEPYLA